MLEKLWGDERVVELRKDRTETGIAWMRRRAHQPICQRSAAENRAPMRETRKRESQNMTQCGPQRKKKKNAGKYADATVVFLISTSWFGLNVKKINFKIICKINNIYRV